MGDVYEENILNLGVGMKGGLTGFQGGGGGGLLVRVYGILCIASHDSIKKIRTLVLTGNCLLHPL